MTATLALALAAAGSAQATDPVPGRTSSWEAGTGAAVRFPSLPGASPVDSAALPPVDLSQLPGGRVALLRGVTSGRAPGQVTVQAVCVRAPGSNLPTDIETVAFERLNEGIQKELARTYRIDRFAPGPTREQGHVARQVFVAEGAPLAPGRTGKLFARGKHQLGFIGSPPEMLLCSLTCAQVAETDTCTALVDATLVDAPFVAPPQPGLFARLAFAVVRRPLATVGSLIGLLLLLLGVAIAAWPPRRPPTLA